MSFAYPEMLWLTGVTLPLLIGFLWWSWRKRARLITEFVQSRLLANLTVGVSAARQKIRLMLLALAVVASMLALARPQWGYAWEEVRQQGLDIIIAIDTSRSMLAQDVAPSRLARAKLAALDLMRQAQHDRLGLVAFAGTAFLQAPLTLDEEAFQQSVEALDIGIIPQGGTALAAAIDAATEAFLKDSASHKALVLFTDGEDHEPGAADAARKAAERGIRIFTIGVGTKNGDLIRIVTPDGKTTFLKDEEGNVIKSALNEKLLQDVAAAGDGFYLHLSGPRPVEELYQRGLAPLPKSEIASRRFQHLRERFQWPLGVAVLALFAEFLLPRRKKIARPQSLPESARANLKPAAVAVLLVWLSLPVEGSVRTAQRAFQRGEYSEAQKQYEELLQAKPVDTRLQYNAGVAAYQAGHYADAAQHFSAASIDPHLNLQQRAFYNSGNSFYRLGEHQTDLEKKIALWEQALKQYEGAVQLDPKDGDAEFNRELLKKKLKQLKQQEQNQNQNQKQNQNQDQNQSQKNKSDPQQKQPGKKNEPKENQPQPSQPQTNDQTDHEKKSEQPQAGNPTDQEPQRPGAEPKKSPTADGDRKSAQSQTGSATRLDEMTPEQAKQLLEGQKQEEKPLLFAPVEKARSNRRSLKDW